MSTRSLRNRLADTTNIWPGFVDVLATLLIVIIFVLMVFTVSQIYLSDAISGRDKALQDLWSQINELSKILVIETKDKEKALSILSETEKELEDTQLNLQGEQLLSEQLQTDVAKKRSELFVQEQNIIALSEQISSLLKELRIVANALETYEGQEIALLETEGLGKRINKALATRIDQLKLLNEKLEQSEKSLNEKILELDLVNQKLNDNEVALQDQIFQYQQLTNDLLEINDSLGLKDATLKEQLDAIRFKNEELARLNKDLIQKDSTIFNLRGKISELNNILSLSEEKQVEQEVQLSNLKNQILSIKEDSKIKEETSLKEIEKMQVQAEQTLQQINLLSNEIDILKNEISILNSALEANEIDILAKDLEIEVLGEKLNKALTSKVFELQKYRSEFFGKLQALLGDREDIKIVGDRFIFETELLFDSASADLQESGKEKLSEIGLTLKETTVDIPSEIDWIIMVEGHTDKRPINTFKFPSNWELSTARANSVLKLLLDIGFAPDRLAAAGYGEFYPISDGDTDSDYQQNRRIELKLTSR